MRSEENLTWRFGAHVDPVHVARLQRSEDPFDARLICHHVLHQLELERRTSLPQLREHQRRQGIVGVPQHEHAAEVGNHLLEQVQLFVWQIKGECGRAGQVATRVGQTARTRQPPGRPREERQWGSSCWRPWRLVRSGFQGPRSGRRRPTRTPLPFHGRLPHWAGSASPAGCSFPPCIPTPSGLHGGRAGKEERGRSPRGGGQSARPFPPTVPQLATARMSQGNGKKPGPVLATCAVPHSDSRSAMAPSTSSYRSDSLTTSGTTRNEFSTHARLCG